jgi:hypothetical protein
MTRFQEETQAKAAIFDRAVRGGRDLVRKASKTRTAAAAVVAADAWGKICAYARSLENWSNTWAELSTTSAEDVKEAKAWVEVWTTLATEADEWAKEWAAKAQTQRTCQTCRN